MFNSQRIATSMTYAMIVWGLSVLPALATEHSFTDSYADATVYQTAYAAGGTTIVQETHGNDVEITIDPALSDVISASARETPVDPAGDSKYIVPDSNTGRATIVYHFSAPDNETFTRFGIDRVQLAAVKRFADIDGAVIMDYKLSDEADWTNLVNITAPNTGESTEYNQFDSDADAYNDPTFNEFTAAGSTDFYLRIQMQRDGDDVTTQLQYLSVSGTSTIPE